MAKNGLLFLIGILVGLGISALFLLTPNSPVAELEKQILHINKPQVIGFLPFWLLSKAQPDYSKYLSTVGYFNLTVGPDGKIMKLTTPQEEDPGWSTLKSDRVKPFFEQARKHNQTLSLLIFNGDNEQIGQMINNPEQSAQNMISDLVPIMKQHNFKDLNLDVEYTTEASEAARMNMTRFIKEVKKGVDKNHLGTFTIDISPSAFIKKYLIDPKAVVDDVDYMVIMTYDYHYIGSLVSGPVAPLYGASESAEFDTDSGIKEVLKVVPAKKVILGVPLYGYEWETLGDFPRAATIPSTGLTASNQRLAQFLQECATCSSKLDPQAEENYIIYKNTQTGTFHQIFLPDKAALAAKIKYAKQLGLGGIALWALGYETPGMLEPLESYR